jgi:hypothetical protein
MAVYLGVWSELGVYAKVLCAGRRGIYLGILSRRSMEVANG